MGEENRETGNRAEDRLMALLQGFGWEYIGGGRDIECESRKHEREEHGIDGYMTYEDPYLSDERGVIVESKSKQWQSWNPSSIQKDAKQARTALECSNRSEDFEEKLNDYESRRRDTAILGAFTNDDEYDHERFQSYVESCKIKKGGGPSHVLILGNGELNRLASIQNKYNQIEERHTTGESIVEADLSFYYPSLQEPRAAPDRRNTISFEYLFSDLIYAKLQKSGVIDGQTQTKDISIVFNSAGVDRDSLEFLYYSLRKNDMLDVDEVWVYSYINSEKDQEEQYDGAVERIEGSVLPPDTPFDFNQLPQIEYNSYADDLTER